MGNAPRQWGATPWTREEIAYPRGRPQGSRVAIIGAGLTGASTAYHLAKRGIGATVVEAGSVGDGASGRTGGLVLEGTAAGPLAEVTSCVSELQALVTAESIDCALHLPGCWEIEHGDRAGKPALPWNDEGASVHIGATVSGGVVEPARLLTGILNAALGLGAEVREHAPVKRVVFRPRPGLEFAEHTIYPGHIVLACNAWLPGLLSDSCGLSSALTFACATQPLDDATRDAIGLAAGIPFYTADLPYLWGRTVDDGRVIFGSGLVFGSPQTLEASDVNAGSSQAALSRLQNRVRRLHPKLNDVRFSASWGGPIAFTQDAVPLLGRLPGSPRIIVAGGYAGHGVALSIRVGQLIARAIAEDADLPRWGALEHEHSRSRPKRR
jgi:gamma-glutamylputrescine oxidase